MADDTKICPPHRYRRRNLTKNKKKDPYLVFKCLECPHYIKTDLAIGTTARCYKCNNPFVITSKHASEVAKPTCANCVIRSDKNKRLEQEVDNILDAILKDI